MLLRAPDLDTCAAGAVLGMVRTYGPNLFILWKAMLLRKRVLFRALPPVSRLCEAAVYTHGMQHCRATPAVARYWSEESAPALLLSVGILDMDVLSRASRGFAACTTERIFEEREVAHPPPTTHPAHPPPRHPSTPPLPLPRPSLLVLAPSDLSLSRAQRDPETAG